MCSKDPGEEKSLGGEGSEVGRKRACQVLDQESWTSLCRATLLFLARDPMGGLLMRVEAFDIECSPSVTRKRGAS